MSPEKITLDLQILNLTQMSAGPPDFMMPLLYTIEKTTINVYKEQSRLVDKEIEDVYDKLMQFFKICATGKETYAPTDAVDRKQILIDAILDGIEKREEENRDEEIINNSLILLGDKPIPSLDRLYVSAFHHLVRSTRRWRKLNGPKGYINFILERVP